MHQGILESSRSVDIEMPCLLWNRKLYPTQDVYLSWHPYILPFNPFTPEVDLNPSLSTYTRIIMTCNSNLEWIDVLGVRHKAAGQANLSAFLSTETENQTYMALLTSIIWNVTSNAMAVGKRICVWGLTALLKNSVPNSHQYCLCLHCNDK
jgi:hypothetical protein